MTAALVRAAERVAPLAPKEPRRANLRDKLRVAEYARRLDAGEDEFAAAWAVLSDAKLGIARWRGAPDSARPSDIQIARKIAALLRRGVPAVLNQARDVVLARVAGLSDKAVRTLDEVTGGDFTDPARARVQLDGARTVIEALGVTGRGTGADVQSVQVHIDARRTETRAEIDALRELLVHDPEAREHARALGIALARQSGGDCRVVDARPA